MERFLTDKDGAAATFTIFGFISSFFFLVVVQPANNIICSHPESCANHFLGSNARHKKVCSERLAPSLIKKSQARAQAQAAENEWKIFQD